MSDWVLVTDRLPVGRKRDTFLCYIEDKMYNVRRVQIHTLKHIHLTKEFPFGGHVVTHWMPLPDAPEASGE